MRRVHALLAIAVVTSAAIPNESTAGTLCSVLDQRGCNPSVCSVFDRKACRPEFQYPQGLRLVVEAMPTGSPEMRAEASPDRKLDTLQDLFAALRVCWVPPPLEQSRLGMQMTVRFSLKSSGELIGSPRVTYSVPDIPTEMKERYHRSILDALRRCTPLSLSPGLGGAVAGRPISMRFIDSRTKPAPQRKALYQ